MHLRIISLCLVFVDVLDTDCPQDASCAIVGIIVVIYKQMSY